MSLELGLDTFGDIATGPLDPINASAKGALNGEVDIDSISGKYVETDPR